MRKKNNITHKQKRKQERQAKRSGKKHEVLPVKDRISHMRRVQNKDKANIDTVVLDVRDGKNTREKVDAILKEQRRNTGSKFFKPSFSLWGYSYNNRGGHKHL